MKEIGTENDLIVNCPYCDKSDGVHCLYELGFFIDTPDHEYYCARCRYSFDKSVYEKKRWK